jgi:hypothetical protein
MGFVDFSEKLKKGMTVIIMCTSAKYIDFITSEKMEFLHVVNNCNSPTYKLYKNATS